MPKIQKFKMPTNSGIQYNPLTPAEAYIKMSTNYFGTNLGNPSTSSSLVNKKNPLFKNGALDLSSLSQLTNYKLEAPSMESSVSAALNADPVSSAAKEGGKGFLSGIGGVKGIGAFAKKNAEVLGAAPDIIETGLKLGGAKEADTASGGEQLFSQATSAAFKGALKTGNPLAIGITGALKGLDMLNRYAGSTAKEQGTIGIDTTGYTTQLSPNAGAKQTLLGSIGWRGKKSSKTAAFNKQTQLADRSNLLASRASYAGKQNMLAAQNTAQDISSQNQQKLAGGINPYLLSAKRGAKINPKKLSNIKKKAQYKVKKVQEGSNIDDGQKFQKGGSFEQWYKTVPVTKNDTTSYNLRRAYELAPKEQLDAFVKDSNAHLYSVYENPKTGIYEFLKSKNHPTINKELEWFNSSDPEAIKFRENYILDKSEDYYKYIPKHALGGEINVIPEGALHARKNNYEGELAEQVTSKGIPVITYDEDDKITQHAEIEHSEIIFNKDVTNQLEEWFKKYNDTEDSSKKKELELECGKYLCEEILENTEDNVGLIEQIQ